ncbi:MAG TPA: group 1 truncated hemoglobin [Oleiagrimonas sp.]|nr:group 1 truncated hemoglobin [Oleiagrimonas sp.]
MFKYSIHAATIIALMLFSQVAPAQQTTMPEQAPSSMSSQSAAMRASAPRDPDLRPVFDEFGGKAGLIALMDDFMANLMADPRTHPYFAPANRKHIKKELVDQFCVILDGPCTYTGRSMKSVHRGMGVDRADFNALVEDLQKAMNKHDIPFRAQNKLLAKLAAMHGAIITQ